MPSVETQGFDEAIAAMKAGPDRLKEALYQATREATGVTVDAIRANTPVAVKSRTPGELLANWRSRVEGTLGGARSTISNKVRYSNFVEYGQHPYHPMRAQPMVAKGVALTTGTVNTIYDVAVRKATAELQSVV